jgi:tetratricopeptide (TPR) repeat protein
MSQRQHQASEDPEAAAAAARRQGEELPPWEHLLFDLQRMAGNAAVHRLLRGGDLSREDVVSAETAGPALEAEELRERFSEAQALYHAARYPQAIVAFQRIRSLPGVPDAVQRDCLWAMGMADLRLGRYATAILLFEHYMTMEGADVPGAEARLEQARSSAGLGDDTDGPEQLERRFDAAMGLFEGGRHRQALVAFERVRRHPDASPELERDCLFNTGLTLLHLQRYATAIPFFEQYATCEGADAAEAKARLEETRRAAGAGIENEQPTPDQLRRRFQAAMSLFEKERYAEAVGAFDGIRRLAGIPDGVRRDAVFNTAVALLRQGNKEKAIPLLERYGRMEDADTSEAAGLVDQARSATAGEIEAEPVEAP